MGSGVRGYTGYTEYFSSHYSHSPVVCGSSVDVLSFLYGFPLLFGFVRVGGCKLACACNV